MDYLKIEEILLKINTILDSNSPINEEKYINLAGIYSKELNLLLKQYPEESEEIKVKNSPYLNYYRQIQHYLVFLIRYPGILAVPHHSEIEQTLFQIYNKEKLIKEKYTDIANLKRSLLSKDNLEKMDVLIGHLDEFKNNISIEKK